MRYCAFATLYVLSVKCDDCCVLLPRRLLLVECALVLMNLSFYANLGSAFSEGVNQVVVGKDYPVSLSILQANPLATAVPAFSSSYL